MFGKFITFTIKRKNNKHKRKLHLMFRGILESLKIMTSNASLTLNLACVPLKLYLSLSFYMMQFSSRTVCSSKKFVHFAVVLVYCVYILIFNAKDFVVCCSKTFSNFFIYFILFCLFLEITYFLFHLLCSPIHPVSYSLIVVVCLLLQLSNTLTDSTNKTTMITKKK